MPTAPCCRRRASTSAGSQHLAAGPKKQKTKTKRRRLRKTTPVQRRPVSMPLRRPLDEVHPGSGVLLACSRQWQWRGVNLCLFFPFPRLPTTLSLSIWLKGRLLAYLCCLSFSAPYFESQSLREDRHTRGQGPAQPHHHRGKWAGARVLFIAHTPSVRGFLRGWHPHATLTISPCRGGRRPPTRHAGGHKRRRQCGRPRRPDCWERGGWKAGERPTSPARGASLSPLSSYLGRQQLGADPQNSNKQQQHNRRLPKTNPAQLHSSVQASPVTSGAVRGPPRPLWQVPSAWEILAPVRSIGRRGRTRGGARRGGSGHRARPTARGTVQAVQTRPWCHLGHHPWPVSLSARVSQAALGERHVHARLPIADVGGEKGRRGRRVGTRGGCSREDDASARCTVYGTRTAVVHVHGRRGARARRRCQPGLAPAGGAPIWEDRAAADAAPPRLVRSPSHQRGGRATQHNLPPRLVAAPAATGGGLATT